MIVQTVPELPERERPRPAPFPHDYEVALDWDGRGAGILEAPPRPAIMGGLPPQFAGREEWWSPEHLLLSSVSLCLMATFQVFAAKKKLKVTRYSSLVKGILDKTPAGLAFTSISLCVDLAVEGADAEAAERLLHEAKRHCIVANSLKTPVDLRTSATSG